MGLNVGSRLEKLARDNGYTTATVYAHFSHRVDVLKKAYGEMYKGRESHIYALAYRGTEQHYVGGK